MCGNGTHGLFGDDPGGYFPYYSFHMPLFIFISGYFHNKETPGIFKFIVHKVKRLIIPFYCWSLFYLLIEELLRGHEFGYGMELTINNWLIYPWTEDCYFSWASVILVVIIYISFINPFILFGVHWLE